MNCGVNIFQLGHKKNNKFRVSFRYPDFFRFSVDTCYHTCYNSIARKGWRAVKGYSSREIIKILKADGWHEVGCTGDHHQFKHPVKKGRVTITHPKKGYANKNIKKHRGAGGDQAAMIYPLLNLEE